MAFKKDFVVSTEDVNTYGFVVLTAGIQLENAKVNCPAFYDHKYHEGTIGHWENFRVEGTNLMATFVCEGITEREKEIIKKMEAGDIKGASIGADPITWSEDPAMLKKGQTRPTLVKSDLFEISATPLPGNKSAIALKRDGQPVTLNATNLNILPDLKPTIDMEKIALALGLNANAPEADILAAIAANKGKNEAAATLTRELLDKASDGLDSKQKEIFVTLSQANVKQALDYADSVKLSTAAAPPAETAAPAATATQKDVKVSDLIQLGKDVKQAAADGKDSFDYLSKHNPVELTRIRTEEPERYAKLTRDYGKGVRYTGKTA